MVTLGHCECLLKECHRTFQLGDVLTRQHRLFIERDALHLCIMHPAGRFEHGLIDGLRGFGIIADFVGPTVLSVQVMQACYWYVQIILISVMPILLVVTDSRTLDKLFSCLASLLLTTPKRM